MKATKEDLLRELWLRLRDSQEITVVNSNGDNLPIKNVSTQVLLDALKTFD